MTIEQTVEIPASHRLIIDVPPDFDTMGQEEIAALFGETP
jgi:hypothetical protein